MDCSSATTAGPTTLPPTTPPTLSMTWQSPLHPPFPASALAALTSSAVFLRLRRLGSPATAFTVLNNSKSSEFCAPLSSFDWKDIDPNRIGTSSINTSCTIWDLQKSAVETQLIAHYKQVNDIARGKARVFVSVSADALSCNLQ